MRQLALAKKLLWLTLGSIFITVVVLSSVLWWQLSSSNKVLSAQAEKLIVTEVEEKLTSNAAVYGEKIAGFINEAYRVPFSLAAILGNESAKDALTRDSVVQLNRSIIEGNSILSSIYSQFEANGFDGNDKQYKSGFDHSVAGQGTLEIYFTRSREGVIEQQVVEDAAEKYVTTLNEFGQREAEWYLCAKDTKKPCIMEPYLYEISPGNSEMMTSLTVPILRDGKFIGLSGVDITLPVFQTMTEQLSKELYNGQARVTLLSSMDLIVGSSHNKDKLGRPLKEAVSASVLKNYTSLKESSGVQKSENEYLVNYPIDIKLAGRQWTLLVEVPAELALQGPQQLSASMQDNANTLGGLILISGLVIAGAAFIIMTLVVKSIVAPLQQIQLRVDNLASSEGDLTQTLTVDTHAELIALAVGFNAFLEKLRDLIAQLKDVSGQTKEQAQIAAHVAVDTKQNVASSVSRN